MGERPRVRILDTKIVRASSVAAKLASSRARVRACNIAVSDLRSVSPPPPPREEVGRRGDESGNKILNGGVEDEEEGRRSDDGGGTATMTATGNRKEAGWGWGWGCLPLLIKRGTEAAASSGRGACAKIEESIFALKTQGECSNRK